LTGHAETGLSFAQPSEVALAYLAGILDGEGHFKQGERTTARGSLTRSGGRSCGLQVTMTDQGAIKWIAENFGGRLYVNGRAKSGRRVYGWVLSRQDDLRYLLPLLIPHLKVKGPQAWALLRLVETLRAQPRYDNRRVGPRVERVIRAALRLQWRYEVALARTSVVGSRNALKEATA
jgi:hypothetical protein